MFTGNGNQDADDKRFGPLGAMQIQEDLGAVMEQFGRTALFLQAGMFAPHHYPDRLFVGADPFANVHFDTILFL